MGEEVVGAGVGEGVGAGVGDGVGAGVGEGVVGVMSPELKVVVSLLVNAPPSALVTPSDVTL